MTELKVYDSLEQLINDHNKIPEGFNMPEFPIPTEDINSVKDILNLIQFLKDNKLENICTKFRKLVDSQPIIEKFEEMIGLEEPKANIATQILSLCNSLNKKSKNANTDKQYDEPLLNTVIYGPPGCGKTTVANFLAELYLKFGVLENGKFIKGDRSNMIGEYVGETAIKTKKRLNEALGGVLFIDEAYQLGHAADGNRCPFAYECINTITQFITEHTGQITIILAGYEKDIKDNFFAQNVGLDRRFPWKYTLERNKPEELVEIFKLQAKKSGYSVGDDSEGRCLLTSEFFTLNKDMFKYSGGDTQTYFDKCKMIHDKRMFSMVTYNKELNKTDLEKGFKMYEKSKDTKENDIPFGMYT